MNDIMGRLDDLLMENCLISAGDMDTFTYEAIDLAKNFLRDCGVQYDTCIYYNPRVAIITWIENDKPIIFAFKFE